MSFFYESWWKLKKVVVVTEFEVSQTIKYPDGVKIMLDILYLFFQRYQRYESSNFLKYVYCVFGVAHDVLLPPKKVSKSALG